MGVGGTGASGLAAGVLGVELCAPLLLLCWLCCWPDDANSDSTSGKHPQRPVLTHVHESGSRRRSSDLFGRRIGSSAVSLHLPSTSGYKKPLSAHRSHEEIGHRRKSHHESVEQETRYHSAPSVIDEVLHRRDWERSTKDLYIPLKPEQNLQQDLQSNSSGTPEAPHAEPESSSIEAKSEEQLATRPCKKHHTNIKSSRGRKEKESTDIKDVDVTESNFYIGDRRADDGDAVKNNDDIAEDVHTKSIYKAKDVKQTFNESIRAKERPGSVLAPLDETLTYSLGFRLDDVIEQLDTLDRSGAEHHTIESRLSMNRNMFPPPSVEPVGYEGGACYLVEVGPLQARGPGPLRACAPGPQPAPASLRARHASDGDILAPTHRPESGAFSESDLDLELEESEERPPPYDEVHHYVTREHKETAI